MNVILVITMLMKHYRVAELMRTFDDFIGTDPDPHFANEDPKHDINCDIFQTRNEEQEEVRGPGPGHSQRYHAEEPQKAEETHQERKSSSKGMSFTFSLDSCLHCLLILFWNHLRKN